MADLQGKRFKSQDRELARAVFSGDLDAAQACVMEMVRDERLKAHEVDLGRSDAAATNRRAA